MPEKYDFSGYATKNNIKCADGRTIRRDAFKDCDGETVPLVWGHKHGSPGDVLGHAILENREDGVYTYGFFNDTDSGKNAKELVKHGDVKALSIYANQLKQKGGDVIHGVIREVSLCLSGANPGARIEDLSFEHSFDEDSEDFEALIFNGQNVELIHSNGNELSAADQHAFLAHQAAKMAAEQEYLNQQYNRMAAQQDYLNHQCAQVEQILQHANTQTEVNSMAENDNRTIADVFNGMTDEEKNVVYYMIGKALEENGNGEGESKVAHNVFEGDNMNNSLAHSAINEAMQAIITDGPKFGSLRKSFEEHMANDEVLAHSIDTTGMDTPQGTVTYGINGIDYLFPEARTLTDTPEFIKRDTDWVDVVLAGVHKTPFSRIKTVFANITEPEARAKGYIKGNQKVNEFFALMKRVTTPQTIYKKQKFDRDDILDITDMNVVAWVKTEMRMMLNEELCRAILVGDGRDISSDDKINEINIRPIVSDANLFTIKQAVTEGEDDEETAKNAIKAALRARKDYKGSGNPIFFTTEDWLTNMLLIEDSIGRRLYSTEAEVASAIRARKIVTVPVLEGYTDANDRELIGIFVNLNDYNVGTDKGGEVNMFDDFDIDFNQYKYLIETRCSGALTKPYSAIALFKTADGSMATTTDNSNQS
ncbi:MAG: phage major capsid protein [Clostridiales bacterium]|nr:phage major capsid protein [Clostridiales bacterium]